MRKEKSSKIIFLFGAKGQGKSYLMIQHFLKKVNGLSVIIDPNGEHEKLGDCVSYTKNEFLNCFRQFLESNKRKFIIVHIPQADEEEIFGYCFELGDMTLLIDESHLYTNSLSYDKKLMQIFRRSRHKQIDIICSTHTPNDLHPAMRLQADEIYSFAQNQEIHLKGFRNFFDNPEKLLDLEKRQFCKVYGESEIGSIYTYNVKSKEIEKIT